MERSSKEAQSQPPKLRRIYAVSDWCKTPPIRRSRSSPAGPSPSLPSRATYPHTRAGSADPAPGFSSGVSCPLAGLLPGRAGRRPCGRVRLSHLQEAAQPVGREIFHFDLYDLPPRLRSLVPCRRLRKQIQTMRRASRKQLLTSLHRFCMEVQGLSKPLTES